MKSNPLLADFNTYLGTTPFSEIKPSHFKPAVEKQILLTKQEIDKITGNSLPPTFENTIEALAFSGLYLQQIQNILLNINSAETSDIWQNTTEEILPMLNDFYNEIRQNKALFERISKVYHQTDRKILNDEQQMLLDKTYKDFVRNGALLSNEDQAKLTKIDQQLTSLKLVFNKNVLHETNTFKLHITEFSDLEGLPQSVIEAARQLAQENNKDGWLFSLHAPSYIPFMKYIKNRQLRRQMSLAFGSRAFKTNAYNNEENVLQIARLRLKRARLLGYKTHAQYVLEERMAQTPEAVLSFLDSLYNSAYPKAQEDIKKLAVLAEKDGIEKLEKWDISYYMNILKKQELNLDEEKLQEYFSLETVLEGVFKIANKLYGLQFKENKQIDTYHPEVRSFEVWDEQGQFKAIFYADFFPRPGKRQGAWMTAYKGQWQKDGQDSRPHISIVTNFSRPSASKPSLLTFNEVTTLFHEFGHALHGMMAQTTYPGLSGTNVYWDFVELPSQIMENWAYEPEALELFAKHYITNENLPSEYLKSLKKSLQFMEGYATTRQLSFGYLDMGWHYLFNPDKVQNVSDYEQQQMAKTQLLPFHHDNNMSVAFSHIFPGGYAAGYYAYKWAEVLDADAFELFKEQGIFNREVAQKFKKLLQSGGTKHPMNLYKDFRGRPPKVDALLKRAGLKA